VLTIIDGTLLIKFYLLIKYHYR